MVYERRSSRPGCWALSRPSSKDVTEDAASKDLAEDAASRTGTIDSLDTVLNCSPAFLETLNERLENGGGSMLLLVAALASFLFANMDSTSRPWLQFWSSYAGPQIGHHHLTRKDWVNEGLMSFFFLAVGLEIKKELLEGSLASASKAAMPCVAALGGMVMPMLIYALVNYIALPQGSFDGVVVPMATDIAFAMGVFCSIRHYLPPATASFLLALATVDDLGAIVVIIMRGGSGLKVEYLFTGLAVLWAAVELGRRGVERSTMRFGILGVILWYCLLSGGINADVAGVAIALCIPMRSKHGEDIVERLITLWTPFSALFVLPLFALANCAMPMISCDGPSGGRVVWAVPLGVMLGLVLGKPLGIFGFVYFPVKMGLISLPDGLGTKDVLTVGMLGGIGFTMCLFLVENTLEGPTAQVTKMAVIVASMLSAGITSLSIVMAARAGALQRTCAGP